MPTSRPPSLFINSKMQELAEERRVVQAVLSDYHIYGWLWEDDAGARPRPTLATFILVCSGLVALDQTVVQMFPLLYRARDIVSE